MNFFVRLGLLALVLGLLSGCALSERMREAAAAIGGAQSSIQERHENFSRSVRSDQARREAQDVPRPWLAGRAQPLARELTLPLALRANVSTTLIFSDGPIDLPTVAQRITAATAIPVHISPEALLPLEMFMPRLAGAQQTASAISAPTTIQLAGGPEPLARILDGIAARLGVMWRYQHERIEFYRTETRVFNVRALTINATAEASLGLGGQKAAEGFTSTSLTSLSGGEPDVLAVLRARIEPFLSKAGVLVAEPGASSSVVITDTPEVLRRIAVYLEHENLALTRRVRLIFEEITVAANDNAEAGLDWNIVFASARVAAAMAMPGSTLADAGGLGIALTEGPFNGSDAIIKALSQVGKVLRRSSVPVLTLNRRPVTHAVRTTFSYIDKVESTALSNGAGLVLPSISVNQREETVGSLLTLIPDAQDDGQILLSVAYDNTVAQPLKSVTFGDKANPLLLQQITIDGNGTVQQVALRPGQPLVIAGFDKMQAETEGRRLNPGVPLALGGSDRVAHQQVTTVMVVTAQLEDGH